MMTILIRILGRNIHTVPIALRISSAAGGAGSRARLTPLSLVYMLLWLKVTFVGAKTDSYD